MDSRASNLTVGMVDTERMARLEDLSMVMECVMASPFMEFLLEHEADICEIYSEDALAVTGIEMAFRLLKRARSLTLTLSKEGM